ncbi:uncharacterized protein LOC115622694 [Scaptodrosophila lebanonensis]|uniref:Uncharacterized protein LOC115622694 n=1 Tax=Drosophila lebanonensis TaxID=7225 RepID=A0A6J2TC85_DROLE|nr:uncharacterized protein LOC115622694 [Scaptodrosophila lebanonensis]
MSLSKYEEIKEKIKNGIYTLAPNGRSTRSTVWRVYRKIRQEDGTILDNVLHCTSCKTLMSFTHKTTTNLRRHKCHLRYLKTLAFSEDSDLDLSLNSTKFNISSNDFDTEMRVDAPLEDAADPTLLEVVEKKHTPTDSTPFVSISGSTEEGLAQPQPHSTNDPLNVAASSQPLANLIDVGMTDAEESNIYAQTWSLEYRKLTEEQKFYAKRAIDEIFVLGRLRRLTLSTVPSVTE